MSKLVGVLTWGALGAVALLASFSHARAFGITLGSVGFGLVSALCFMAAIEVFNERS